MTHQTENEFEVLENRVREAGKNLVAAMEKRWPIGTRVLVLLKQGQKVPSRGSVVGFSGPYAYVRVSIDRAPDPKGRWRPMFVRDIRVERIVGKE